MYFTYIIRSQKHGTYYVGNTANIGQRLTEHNRNRSAYTRSKVPWDLVYFEEFDTRSEAIRREKEIKYKKSRKYIEQLIYSHSKDP